MKISAIKSLAVISVVILALFASIFVFWNLFPLTEMKSNQDGTTTFQAPGIYVKQSDNSTYTDGIIKVDYARMKLSSYKALKKAAATYSDGNGENYFSEAVKAIEENARSFGGVEAMIAEEHKNFIFF